VELIQAGLVARGGQYIKVFLLIFAIFHDVGFFAGVVYYLKAWAHFLSTPKTFGNPEPETTSFVHTGMQGYLLVLLIIFNEDPKTTLNSPIKVLCV
jgi:hypothetical protein